jgi:hypothetical protein
LGHRTVLGMDLHRVRVSHDLTKYRGKKFSPQQEGGQVQEYGGISNINDTIGVLLEFTDSIGSISYYRNGVIILSKINLLGSSRESI